MNQCTCSNILYHFTCSLYLHVKKHYMFSFIALLQVIMPRLSEHERSGAVEMLQLVCVFLTSRDIIIAIRQLYSSSEIVIRLHGQLNIDAGLVNQNDDPTYKRQLTSSLSTIFASTISVPAGYRQCQTNRRAPRVISIKILNKNIIIQLL